jgi:hypothetical protein
MTVRSFFFETKLDVSPIPSLPQPVLIRLVQFALAQRLVRAAIR